VRSDRTDYVAQQRVARRVSLSVVDVLESVDVDVGEHEASVAVPSAVDLALEHDIPKLSAERAGELIDLRVMQLRSRVLAIRRCVVAIACGELAVRLAMVAVGRRVNAVVCRVLAIMGGVVSVRCSLVGVCWGAVTIRCRPVTAGCRLRADGLRLVAIRRHLVALGCGVLALGGGCVSARGLPIIVRLGVLVGVWVFVPRSHLHRVVRNAGRIGVPTTGQKAAVCDR
jgi:hypothetical protein